MFSDQQFWHASILNIIDVIEVESKDEQANHLSNNHSLSFFLWNPNSLCIFTVYRHCITNIHFKSCWIPNKISQVYHHYMTNNDREISPKQSTSQYQWEFQDPKVEVLYHIRPYFVVYSIINHAFMETSMYLGKL